MRYSLKFKLDCIRKKKDSKFVATPEGVKRKSFTAKLGTWIRTYDIFGIKELKHNKKPLTVYEKIVLIKRIESVESISEVSISAWRSNSLVLKKKLKTIEINHKKVQRIMRENNLKGIHPKVKYHSYKDDNGLPKNILLLLRKFI